MEGNELTEAISATMVALYARFYGHDRTTATTYINDNVVVCILEDILSSGESEQIAAGVQPGGRVRAVLPGSAAAGGRPVAVSTRTSTKRGPSRRVRGDLARPGRLRL